jgi:hypothetical protein
MQPSCIYAVRASVGAFCGNAVDLIELVAGLIKKTVIDVTQSPINANSQVPKKSQEKGS